MTIGGAGERWTASGAAWLTGEADGPCLVPPAGVVERIEGLGARLGLDALGLLGERAAIAGLSRGGTASCGRGARLLPAADGWLALSLVREDDLDLLPAWIGSEARPPDAWSAVADRARTATVAQLVTGGRALGLAVARVGEVAAAGDSGVAARRVGSVDALARPPLVVDLSSLWAGPLAAHVLGAHGSSIVKVESRARPDGARRGPAEFFDLLHAGHRSVALDFREDDDRDRLRQLITAADVVIEASRPRALRQLGIEAEEVVATGPRVWVSITGYGRYEADGMACAFGDDAAAGGGLVAWGTDGVPRFAVDAIADPLTGLTVAASVLDALAAGDRWLLDVALARVAADVAGPDAREPWPAVEPGAVARPLARARRGSAPGLGADTAAVLAELGIA